MLGARMPTPRGTLTLVSLSLALSACSSSSPSRQGPEHPPPGAGRIVELGGGPAIARRVVLEPLAPAAKRVCRAAQATTQEPLLCPRRLPRPAPSLVRH